jgi:hypothetical protein
VPNWQYVTPAKDGTAKISAITQVWLINKRNYELMQFNYTELQQCIKHNEEILE